MKTKETKEAIMFLENTLYMCIRGEDDIPGYKTKYNHWIRKVIALLERGEKYEAIVKELKEGIAVGTGICANWLRSDIKRLERKYSSKGD